MDEKTIDRINELYHKSKGPGLTPEEKAAVSHRGKALAVFDEKLRDYLKGKK